MTRKAPLALLVAVIFGCDPGVLQTGAGGSGGSPGSGGSTGSGGSGGSTGSGGSGGSSGSTGGNMLAGTIGANQTLTGDWVLADNTTIAAGVTLTVDAGATLHAAASKTLTVQGTLAINGTAAAPVTFQSQAHTGPGGWAGIAIATGGTANISWLTIHDASTALTTAGNSHYTIDHLTIDTSSTTASIGSDGTINHGAFHGNDASTPAFMIMNASPHVTDTVFDHGSMGSDYIIVNGTGSAPVFDYIEVTQSHCAFHANQGMLTVTNSYIHGNAYALMLESSMTTFQNSNLENNGINIGDCFGGTATVSGSYVQGTLFSGTNCGSSSNMATAPLTGIGPRP